MTTPAKAATVAIIRKKYILSMLLQKLPSQPPMKLPTKLVPSHTPIIIDTMRAGAAFDTSEKAGRDYMLGKGVRISQLPDAELARVKEMLALLKDKALAELEKAGKPAKAFLDAYTL